MSGKREPAWLRWLGIAAMLTMLFPILAGCVAATPAAISTTAPAAAPQAAPTSAPAAAPTSAPAAAAGSGKVLRMARQSEPFSPFIPWELDDNPAIFIGVNVYDGLLRISADGMGLEPGLASKFVASPDGLTLTFTLRDNATFSDGTPLKAEDVKASLEAVADLTKSGKSAWSSNYTAIKEVQIADPKTIKLILTQPAPALPSALAMFSAGIVPADLAVASQAKDFDVTKLWKTRGTGAFYVDGWQKGDLLVLKRNPHYWKGTPALDEVDIEFVPDDNTRILKLEGGETDVIDFVPLSQLATVGAQPGLKAQAFTVQALSNMIINVTKKPLDDVKIRQALNYATDKDAIIKNVYFGQGKPQNSPIPPGMYWDKDLPGYPFNLEKAKQLMKESSAPNGFTVEMQVRSGNTEYTNIATIVKDQWAKIGVNVNLVNLETSLVRTNYRSGNYEIMPIGYTNDMNDPTEATNFMVRGNVSPFAYWTHWDDPAVDDMITKADLEMNPTTRETMYKQIQKTFLDAAPQIFLVYRPDTAAWQNYVEGFNIEAMDYYRFENVKLNK